MDPLECVEWALPGGKGEGASSAGTVSKPGWVPSPALLSFQTGQARPALLDQCLIIHDEASHPPWFGLWSSWNRVTEVAPTHGLAWNGRWEKNREKGEPRTMAEEGRCCSGRDRSKHWCLDYCSQFRYTLCPSCDQRVVDCLDYLVFNQWQAPVREWRLRSRKKPGVSAPLYLDHYLGQWLRLPRGSVSHGQSLSVVSVADQCLGLASELWKCHLYALSVQPRDGSRFLLLLISRLLHISLFLLLWYFCNLYRATKPLLLKYFMRFFFGGCNCALVDQGQLFPSSLVFFLSPSISIVLRGVKTLQNIWQSELVWWRQFYYYHIVYI